MSVPEQKFVSTLRQGAVYFAPTRVGSPNYHFCIVMNENPTADDLVLLEIISSQVEKTKRRVALQQHYVSSAVELDQAVVAFLHKPSVVDCNSCLECSKGLFTQDLKEPRASYAGQIPQDILEKLITETMASTGVRPEQKRRINKVRAELIEKRKADLENGIVPSTTITIKVS